MKHQYCKTFEEAYSELNVNEGGYADNKKDLGGETYCGISRVYHPSCPIWDIIDRYKELIEVSYELFLSSLKHNEQLNEMVKAFFYEKFWLKNNLHLFSDKVLAKKVFEIDVNSGYGGKALQRVLNFFDHNLTVDGIIGKITIKCLETIRSKTIKDNLYRCLDAIQVYRWIKQTELIPEQKYWSKIWISRDKNIKKVKKDA